MRSNPAFGHARGSGKSSLRARDAHEPGINRGRGRGKRLLNRGMNINNGNYISRRAEGAPSNGDPKAREDDHAAEAALGFELFTDGPERLGWLFNMNSVGNHGFYAILPSSGKTSLRMCTHSCQAWQPISSLVLYSCLLSHPWTEISFLLFLKFLAWTTEPMIIIIDAETLVVYCLITIFTTCSKSHCSLNERTRKLVRLSRLSTAIFNARTAPCSKLKWNTRRIFTSKFETA
jgi:hypothetical protein